MISSHVALSTTKQGKGCETSKCTDRCYRKQHECSPGTKGGLRNDESRGAVSRTESCSFPPGTRVRNVLLWSGRVLILPASYNKARPLLSRQPRTGCVAESQTTGGSLKRKQKKKRRDLGHTETERLIKAFITQCEGQEADCKNTLTSSHRQ